MNRETDIARINRMRLQVYMQSYVRLFVLAGYLRLFKDALGVEDRCDDSTNNSGGASISSYEYTYDANGNRTKQVEVQNGQTDITTYEYDKADRLKDFTVAGTDTTTTEYTFDGYNRKTEKVTTNGSVTDDRTYTYDESDWLTSIDEDCSNCVNGSSGSKVISYGYDNNGNMVSKSDSSLPDGDMTFEYDSRNQLVEAERGPPAAL